MNTTVVRKLSIKRKNFFSVFIVFLLLFLHSTSSLMSQEMKVSIAKSNLTLGELINKIEEQSNFLFVYNSGDIDLATKILISKQEDTIKGVLSEALSQVNLNYVIEGNNVVIKKSEIKQQIAKQLVNGIVLDESGNPIIGASIQLKEEKTGTITNLGGEFSVEANRGQTLIVSYLGFISQEVKIGTQKTYRVFLVEDTKKLEEIVVVGYATQKKINLSGSVASINLADLSETRPITNITQGLQGQLAGLSIEQTSGLPGAESMNILIRGRGTLNNAAPLVLIDGIVGSLSDISPNDVESVSILKDAASAAIYGSRAANGVILVTTKQGSKEKIDVNYTSYVGFQQPTIGIDVVDNYPLYMETLNKAQARAGLPILFEESIIQEWREMSGLDEIYANTNWYNEVFRPAFIQEHSIQTKGGTEQTDFLFSLSYQDNGGIMPETDYQKYSFRVNLGAKVSPFIKTGINVNGYHSISQNNEASTISNYIGYISNSSPGTLPVSSDGRFGSEWAPGGNLSANNIFASFADLDRKAWLTYISVKPTITVEITPNITWHTTFAAMFRNGFYKTKENAVNMYNLKTNEVVRTVGSARPTLIDVNSRAKRFVGDSYFNWAIPLKSHNLNFILGYNQEYEEESDNADTAFDMISSETDVMDATTTGNKPTGGFSNRALLSFFGRVNYDYKSRYIFEANLRFDGSSKFARGHRWGYFPSFSAAWRISEESFMESSNIDNLKLRLSWGRLGNNRSGDYATQSLYVNSNAVLNGSVVSGLAPGSMSNEDLTWESTTMTNIGLDFNFLSNRISVEADVFNKQTDGILIQLPVPGVLGGLTAPYQNAAIVTNKGVELTLGWNDKINQNFHYGATLNYTFVRNKVNKYRGNVATYSNQRILREGLKIYPYYVREVECIATQEKIDEMLADGYVFYPSTPQPGDFIYKDQQEPGESGYKIINDDDRVVKGNSTPEHSLGLSLYANWKGFSFSALLQGVTGINRYLNGTWYTNVLKNGSQINKKFLDAWTEDNLDSKIPAITTNDGGRNTVDNDFWLQDASYLRLKNIQIGYTIPSKITNKLSIDRLRIYTSLENLITLTSYEGLDPEQGGTGNYPILQRFVCGVSITL